MNGRDALQATVDSLVQAGKGILAADESGPTIAKRFKAIGVESTEENRRAYRNLLLATPGLGAFISGVILYEETLVQRADDGTPLPQLAARQGIVPGIKVDAGKIALAHAPGDEITQGLDGLAKRLDGYKEQGARFAKWRAVYNVSDTLPSRLAIEANAEALARYAAICQERRRGADRRARGADGRRSHPRALRRGDRCRSARSLRCSVPAPGGSRAHAAEAEHGRSRQGAGATGLGGRGRRSDGPRPAAMRAGGCAGIFFLSGGQTPAEATAHLDAINRLGPQPWALSFSYGRALQDPVLQAWRGQASNARNAQDALLERARLNSAARDGRYDSAMEVAGRQRPVIGT